MRFTGKTLFLRSRSVFRLRRLLIAAAGLPAILFILEMGRVFVGTNRHTVIEGRVFRCSQPSPGDLKELVARNGIRTVINLRGLSPSEFGPGAESNETNWYDRECRTSHELNLSQEDITLSANRLPPPAELRRLVEVLDRTAYPILIHCKAGADRTGLVSMMVLLLQTDTPLEAARRQLWPRYGHFRFGRTAAIDHFFELYDRWLSEQNLTHSSALFRDWVLRHYVPGPAASRLTWPDTTPVRIASEKPIGIRVRAENRSVAEWHMRPGTYAGIHLAYMVFDSTGAVIWSGRTGLRMETVTPGAATEFLVPIMGLKKGTYQLIVDLHDARGAGIPFRTNSFVQFGDESLATEIIVAD